MFIINSSYIIKSNFKSCNVTNGNGHTAYSTSATYTYIVPEDDDIKLVSFNWYTNANSEYDPGDVLLSGTCTIYKNDEILQRETLSYRAFKNGSTYNVYNNVTSSGTFMLDVNSGDKIQLVIQNDSAYGASTERYFTFSCNLACIHLKP